MPISKQCDAIITHALSQLVHCWLPIDGKGLGEERWLPTRFSLTDWQDIIEQGLKDRPQSAWALCLDRRMMSRQGLATAIFDNLLSIYENGGCIIDIHSEDYPYLLRHITDPPACLIGLGDISLLHRSKIAVIGSRKASSFALREALAIGKQLALRDICVVSGGALGCDGAAHRGALEARLRPAPTIVVFAGGLARLYPNHHQGLFQRLKSEGALFLSERLWHYPARPMDFPIRNRIIAGLSQAVVLVQAALRSGALHTAAYALDQGREVLVLEHDRHNVMAEGSQALIEEGAMPFASVEDLLSLSFVSQ